MLRPSCRVVPVLDRRAILAALGAEAFALPPRAFVARLAEILTPEKRLPPQRIDMLADEIAGGRCRIEMIDDLAPLVIANQVSTSIDGIDQPAALGWLIAFAPDDHHAFVRMAVWHGGASAQNDDHTALLAGMIEAGLIRRADLCRTLPELVTPGEPFSLPDGFTIGEHRPQIEPRIDTTERIKSDARVA